MTSRKVQPFLRFARSRAFTIVELLVAISVLTLIVLVLYGLFDQVQRALRGNVAQVDVLEGRRSAMQLMAGELEQMDAGNLPASTNLYISLTAVPHRQALLDAGTNRVNVLQQIFFSTHANKTWFGIGYRVLLLATNGIANQLAENGVGTLCRYSFPVNDSDFPNLPPPPSNPAAARTNLFWHVMNQPFSPTVSNLTNYQPILDGVVHFRIHAFDTNGMLMVSNIYSNARIITNVVFQGSVTEEIQYAFTNSALPAYLEMQMGVLEPHVLERYKAFPDPTVASNYLARQVGAVHLFQQRIPIHAAK